MEKHQVVSHEDWVDARKSLLEKEKEFSKLRDELSRERQALPWKKVEKDYIFNGPDGKASLSDLFGGRSQLIVYHFMLGPGWDEGCKSCSFLADHFNPAVVHLKQRDVTMVIEKYKKRMGWTFKWVSSFDNDFNYDYHVSFPREAIDNGNAYYNYRPGGFSSAEAPGASVFYKDDNGDIFHTYSTYARGLDMFIAAYHYLDIVPKGRDEDGLSYTMEWVRRHDEYDNGKQRDHP